MSMKVKVKEKKPTFSERIKSVTRRMRPVSEEDIDKSARDKKAQDSARREEIQKKRHLDPVRVMTDICDEEFKLLDKMVGANNVGDERSYREWKKLWLNDNIEKNYEPEIIADPFLDYPEKWFDEAMTELVSDIEKGNRGAADGAWRGLAEKTGDDAEVSGNLSPAVESGAARAEDAGDGVPSGG